MTTFYNYLDKFPRDEALCLTQLRCLQGRLPDCDVDTANPLFWAGFNLYGDYRTLKSFLRVSRVNYRNFKTLTLLRLGTAVRRQSPRSGKPSFALPPQVGEPAKQGCLDFA
jgi:hypothetical protein